MSRLYIELSSVMAARVAEDLNAIYMAGTGAAQRAREIAARGRAVTTRLVDPAGAVGDLIGDGGAGMLLRLGREVLALDGVQAPSGRTISTAGGKTRPELSQRWRDRLDAIGDEGADDDGQA